MAIPGDKTPCGFERGHWFPGYLRVALRVTWWNVFHICVLAAFIALAASGQGTELLAISREQERDFVGAVCTMIAPLVLFVLVVIVSSFITGRAGTWQLHSLCQAYEIDLDACKRFAQLWMPVLICLVPSIAIAYLNHDMLWVWSGLVLVAIGIVLIAAFRKSRAVQRLTNPDVIPAFPLWGVPVAAMVVGIVASFAMANDPPLARRVGTLGVMLVALGTWSALLTLLLVALPIKLRLPSLAAFVPIVWLIVIWKSDPNLFPRSYLSIQAPQSIALQPPPDPDQAQTAFRRWLLRFDPNDEVATIPVFLVSAEGGGIRSAYWTARVLAEINKRSNGAFGKHVFALSGVSGGSLGVVAFRETINNPALNPTSAVDRIESLLGRDYLAPLAARALVTEPLWQVFGVTTPRDTSFERQLASDWTAEFGSDTMTLPFLKAFPRGGGGEAPLVILNATNVESGRRVMLSNMGIRTHQLLAPFSDVHGLQPVMPLVTVAEAVHLSARFPYLSPPASLVALVPTPDGKGSVPRVWGRVVDGGYLDNSGADALSLVLRSLMQLRTAAQLQEEAAKQPRASTTMPGLVDRESAEWLRVRKLATKVVFAVIVIRNDPYANTLSGIPSLTRVSTRRLSEEDLDERFLKGGLVSDMPTSSPVSEVLSPPETILSAREARGIASRFALNSMVIDGRSTQQSTCQLARRIRMGMAPTGARDLLTSERCASDDFYREISLADEILDARAGTNLFGQSGCKVEDIHDDVALGWVLSKPTRNSMSCLARASDDIKDMVDFVEEATR